ncbi:MAG: hypothetical protein NVS3B12_02850 [Acidimicrobiales bacterium]
MIPAVGEASEDLLDLPFEWKVYRAGRLLSQPEREVIDMQQITMTVTGMDCRSCEERLERAVGHLDGVRRFSAHHADDRVDAVVDDDSAIAALRARIISAGFEVK